MKKRILTLLPLVLLMVSILCVPAFALTEAEVEAQVAASSKEAVTENVLIWFLCAVAFLKVSQKIDSILGTLGVNVGRTGGSLMAEAMVAARGVTMIAKAGGHAVGGAARSGSSSASGQAPSGSTGGFFKGGLIGMAGRHITNSAVKTATTLTAAVHTAQSQSAASAAHTASATHTASSVQSGGAGVIHTDSTAQSATIQSDSSAVSSQEHTSSEAQSDAAVFADSMSQQEGIVFTGHEAQSAVHSESGAQAPPSGGGPQDAPITSRSERTHTQGNAAGSNHTSTHVQTILPGGIGGAAFCRSLAGDGKFANDVISMVARGAARSTGCITGDMAAQSLNSYLGHRASDLVTKDIPYYSGVEIGGGRITGTEFPRGSTEGTAFGMYDAGQYAAPEGPHEKIHTADGALWYKQYAQDAVERKPYKAPDGTVAYEERIVKKLPNPPKRKDRM